MEGLEQTNNLLDSHMLATFFGFLLGVCGSYIALYFFEPKKVELAAHREFGKWLEILPCQLDRLKREVGGMIDMLTDVLRNVDKGLRSPGFRSEIRSKYDMEMLVEIRKSLLGWERSSSLFALLTDMISAVERANFFVGQYNDRMAGKLRFRAPGELEDADEAYKTRVRSVRELLEGMIEFQAALEITQNAVKTETGIWSGANPLFWKNARFGEKKCS